MIFLITLTFLTLIWYLLKIVAYFSHAARNLVNRLSVYTRFMHYWALSAPATFTYVAIFSAFTLVQRTTNNHLIGAITNMNSTSLVGLSKNPIGVLLDSALWVDNGGAGLVLYVAIFATIAAWSERKYGSPRIILISLSGHILGSLLTALVKVWAINSGNAPENLATMTDVGVSYILVAACAAALPLMHKYWLLFGTSVAFAFIIVPIFVNQTVWDLGHFFATAIGLLVALLAARVEPIRKTLPVRQVIEDFRKTESSILP